MAEKLRIFVSATQDLDAERAIVGRAVADLPLQIGIEIRRTPAEGAGYDDIFELNRDRVLRICQLLQEKKLDLTWAPQCRPDRMDPELLVEMKKAGCSRILYGCESASPAL